MRLRLACLAPRTRDHDDRDRERVTPRKQSGMGAAAAGELGAGSASATAATSPAAEADALQEYLGKHTSQPLTPAHSAAERGAVANTASGGWSGGSAGSSSTFNLPGDQHSDEPDPYDADSDCPDGESRLVCSGSGRHFRPAHRTRPPQEAEREAEQEAVEGSGGSVADIIDAFERMSMGSGGGDTLRAEQKREREAATRAPQATAAPAASQQPSRAAHIRGLSSASGGRLDGLPPAGTPSTSCSISLAHFLPASTAGGSTANSSTAARRTGHVRRVGSTQLLVDPESPPPPAAAAAASAAATAAPGASGGDGASVAAQQQQHKEEQEGRQQRGTARTLHSITTGHFVSLDKLREQSGSFDEAPKDLLSLMARRIFASRSALLGRLCSEGRLSDLQAADDSRLQTPSVHTATASRCPASPSKPPAPALAPAQEEQSTFELPRLPPIRTSVGQRARPRAASQSGGSASNGGSTSQQHTAL